MRAGWYRAAMLAALFLAPRLPAPDATLALYCNAGLGVHGSAQSRAIVFTRDRLRNGGTAGERPPEGWRHPADLVESTVYLHRTLGRVRFVRREGADAIFTRVGSGETVRYTLRAGDRFALANSPGAGQEVARLFAHDFALHAALGVLEARLGDPASPANQRLAAILREIDPTLSYPDTVRSLTRALGYADGVPSEESVALARALVVRASHATGEDLVRSGVLRSLSRGTGHLTRVSDPTLGSLFDEGIAVVGGSPELAGTTLGALGPYYPASHPLHGTDPLTRAIRDFENNPTQAGAVALLGSRPELVDHFVAEARAAAPGDSLIVVPAPSSGGAPLHLARALAQRLGGGSPVPVVDAVTESPDRPPQMAQWGRLDRLRNTAGEFRVMRPEDVRGKTIVLVDDVLATGATVHEVARLLYEAGARRVLIFTAGTVSSAQPAPRPRAARPSLHFESFADMARVVNADGTRAYPDGWSAEAKLAEQSAALDALLAEYPDNANTHALLADLARNGSPELVGRALAHLRTQAIADANAVRRLVDIAIGRVGLEVPAELRAQVLGEVFSILRENVRGAGFGNHLRDTFQRRAHGALASHLPAALEPQAVVALGKLLAANLSEPSSRALALDVLRGNLPHPERPGSAVERPQDFLRPLQTAVLDAMETTLQAGGSGPAAARLRSDIRAVLRDLLAWGDPQPHEMGSIARQDLRTRAFQILRTQEPAGNLDFQILLARLVAKERAPSGRNVADRVLAHLDLTRGAVRPAMEADPAKRDQFVALLDEAITYRGSLGQAEIVATLRRIRSLYR